MRIIIYYLFSLAIMVIYGGQVCPFIDSLTILHWSKILIVFFSIIFLIRTILIRQIVLKRAITNQPRAQFILELMVFILAGIGIAVYNHFWLAFPPLASGAKVLVGMLTMGFFLSIDMAMERERIVLGMAQKEGDRFDLLRKFYPLTKKIAWVAILVLVFIAAVILLVIGKDIYWITGVDSQNILFAQQRVSMEIAFVVSVTTGMVLNLIYSYSKNLKLFFNNETQVLTEVNQGNLDGYVPVLSQDEFALIADHTNRMIDGLREKREIQNVFGKVVSPEIARRLLSQGKEGLRMGGDRRDLVILVSDIRNFTTMTETMNPEKLVKGLNQYFSDMITIIHEKGGIVDKFIGDGILAVFGLDNPHGAPDRALATARKMLSLLHDKQSDYLLPIHIGVGIHCGDVIAGNIGSSERLEFTFIGDAVNTAARLESLTKELKRPLVVSERIYSQFSEIHHGLPWVDFGDQALKGKAEKVRVFGLDEHDLSTK